MDSRERNQVVKSILAPRRDPVSRRETIGGLPRNSRITSFSHWLSFLHPSQLVAIKVVSIVLSWQTDRHSLHLISGPRAITLECAPSDRVDVLLAYARPQLGWRNTGLKRRDRVLKRPIMLAHTGHTSTPSPHRTAIHRTYYLPGILILILLGRLHSRRRITRMLTTLHALVKALRYWSSGIMLQIQGTQAVGAPL